jgi:preprotein translocase subunit SecB
MSDTEQQPLFNIEKIYIKDLSIETPNAPQIFLEHEQPQIEIKLNTEGKGFDNGLFEVVLTVTATAKIGDKTVFLVEAGQAGIFQIRNIPEKDLEPILAVACPNILFPYARETISDSVNRAGFPPLLLAPVNFEGLYQQRLQAQAQQQQAASELPVQ